MVESKTKTNGKGTTKKQRVIKYELEWRQDKVLELRRWNYTVHEITHLINNGGETGTDDKFRWDLSAITVTFYLNKAMERERALQPVTNPQELLLASKHRWESLINIAKRTGDVKNIGWCQAQLDKLNGLEQVNIKVSVHDIRSKTDEELLNELELLRARNKKVDDNTLNTASNKSKPTKKLKYIKVAKKPRTAKLIKNGGKTE